MKILVTGGAASGKSAYAEQRALELGDPLVYIATMRVGGAEDEARVERHRLLRDGKGFTTAECPTPDALMTAAHELEYGATVLLEDLGNLVADGLFGSQGEMRPVGTVHDEAAAALAELGRRAANLIVVGNEVGCGMAPDTDEMRAYIRTLGSLACEYAATCDEVVECVCGIAHAITDVEAKGNA